MHVHDGWWRWGSPWWEPGCQLKAVIPMISVLHSKPLFLKMPTVVFRGLSTILRDPRIPHYSTLFGDPRCEEQSVWVWWDSSNAVPRMDYLFFLYNKSPYSILKDKMRAKKWGCIDFFPSFLSATSRSDLSGSSCYYLFQDWAPFSFTAVFLNLRKLHLIISCLSFPPTRM